MIRRRDAAAELLRHRLHAVTDAEYRHAKIEYRLRGARRICVGDGFGTAGEDDPARLEGADVRVGDVPGADLAVDADLAHAPRNQLCVLRAEVENEDPVGVDVRQAGG